MNIQSISTIGLFLFTVLIGAIACQKETSSQGDGSVQNITVQFKPVVGGQNFAYGNNYTNNQGETFSVRAFKFYMSSIEVMSDNPANKVKSDDYYLVDFTNTASTAIQLKSIPAQYTKISFFLGVDSLHNVSGAQEGALDPANGMFWTWNSGYIMAKLEGYAPASNQPNNLFEYHIGGFRANDNVVKKVTMDLTPAHSIDTRNGKTSTVQINADVNKWFNGVHPISIASVPVCMTPGALAQQIAENYLTMFSIDRILNE